MIKKIILLAMVSVFTTTFTFAQKPVARNVSTELIFHPFSYNTMSLENMINGIKFRFFLKDKLALRTSLNIAADGNTITITDPSGPGIGQRRVDNFSTDVLAGLEWHFSGTEKLSPYIGFDAGIGYKVINEKLTNTDDFLRYRENFNRERTSGSIAYKLNLIAGADYYFTQKIFVGGELGLTNALTHEKSIKTTYSGSAAPANSPVAEPDRYGVLIKANAVGGIRLGFIF